MLSEGLYIMEVTGAVWAVKRARGPRRGRVSEDCFEDFKRLLEMAVEEGRRAGGAGGAREGLVVQMAMVVSEEAVKRRVGVDGWKARDSMEDLWL